MSTPQVSEFLSERDRTVYPSAGWGVTVGRGSRPAILIVDVTYKFTGEKSAPILVAQADYPMSCGEEAWRGIVAIGKLLDAARPKKLPVFYTVMRDFRLDGVDAGRWIDKNPKMLDYI